MSDIDGRTRAARHARQLIDALAQDITAASGSASLTAAQDALIRRAAMLAAIVEDSEARWLSGKTVDLAIHGALVDRLRRLLEALGLNRPASQLRRDVTSEVIEHLSSGAAL